MPPGAAIGVTKRITLVELGVRNVILYPVQRTEWEPQPPLPALLAPYLTPAERARLAADLARGRARLFARQATDRRRWGRVRRGDVVLFTSGGRVFRGGRVLHTDVIPEVAVRLWPPREHGGVWDHLIVVGRLREMNVPYATLNRISGDSPRYVPFGFRLMAPERAARVLAALARLEATRAP